ncbi:MAG: SCO family protein [Chloroflexi bacterium]|nr:SCO family protein [Chloroflexota bacterium]
MHMPLRISLLILGLLFLAACRPQPHEFGGLLFEDAQPVPDFSLAAANKQSISLSDYRGQFVFVYFGYTYCPDLCPDTLAKLARVRRQLGDQADQMQVIMISVDPERDTPDKLAEYVEHFSDSFIGLTGSPAEVDAAGAPFGLFYQKHDGTAASGYLVDHTARTYLLDRDGRILIAYPHDAPDTAITADLRYLLAQ